MVQIKQKKRGKKTYMYAEHTFRLQDSSIKTASKLIKKEKDATSQQVRDYFKEREIQLAAEIALKKYKSDNIFTKDRITEFERTRIGFKYIKNKLTDNQFNDLLKRFTANFTYESNAIEGNSLTLKDVTLFLFEGIIPANKQLREINETRNTHQAHQLLFKKKINITIKDILKIQKIIVRDMDVTIGWKTVPNYLAMRSVKTTEPENVAKEMEALIKWYNQVKDNWHPIKVAAHFHAKFEKIHPFEDGNGRVGRIFMNAILMKAGYSPLIIRKTMRQSYFHVLDAADHGHFENIEQFTIEKYKATYKKFFEVYVKYL